MKAIVFDFDGVIVDSFNEVYEIHKQFVKGSTVENYKSFFDGNIYDNKSIKEADKDMIKDFFEKTKSIYLENKVDPKVKKALEELSEKYKLFLITSNTEEISQIFLDNNEIDVFDEIMGYETHKSKIEKFKILFSKYSLEKEDCIFVTDTLGDLKEGNAIGVRCYAVLNGFHERERLERGEPHKILDSMIELVNELD